MVSFPDAEGVLFPEGDSDALESWARGRSTGGVCGRGTDEEDDPATWETLASPRRNRNDGEPAIRPREDALRGRGRVLAGPMAPRETRVRTQVGRRQGTTGAEADGGEGVGGPHTSDEAG